MGTACDRKRGHTAHSKGFATSYASSLLAKPAVPRRRQPILPPCRFHALEQSRSVWTAVYSTALEISGAHLAGAKAEPFVAGEFFQAHGTARADFIGADANLSAHAELTAIGEPG